MEDNNIDIEEDHEQQQAEAAEEEDQEQIIASDAADKRRLHLISLLQGKNTFLNRTGNKIDELVEEFLVRTEDDLHEHLCSNKVGDGIEYQGLDKDRDTEKELETTLRFFPNVLSRKKKVCWWNEIHQEWVEYSAEGKYPIHFLLYLAILVI
jgi:hypothetical protein